MTKGHGNAITLRKKMICLKARDNFANEVAAQISHLVYFLAGHCCEYVVVAGMALYQSMISIK